MVGFCVYISAYMRSTRPRALIHPSSRQTHSSGWARLPTSTLHVQSEKCNHPLVKLDVEHLWRLGGVEQREGFAFILRKLRRLVEFGLCLRDRILHPSVLQSR